MRRGNSGGCSTKREPFKKLSVHCNKIRRVLEEGPCGYRELVEKTKIPEGTIDRALRFLKSIEDITSIKRRWMLVAHIKAYKNIQEYKIHLGHSKELVKGILAINDFLPQFTPQHDLYTGDILAEQGKKLKLHSSSEMWPYALQHLKTGYRGVFDLFEKCSNLLDMTQDIETATMGKALEQIVEKFPDIQSATSSEDLGVEGRNNTDEKSEISLIQTEEERFQLEEQTAEARCELEDQLTWIIRKVMNGEPLSGRCSLCPKVDISKSEPLQKNSRANDV